MERTRVVIPSVDIIGNSAVRLVRGKEGTKRIFGDPLELAAKYEAAGFEILHVVDLDAAFGRKGNLAILGELRKVCKKMKIQWAGGLRSYALASDALAAGADSVVFGTALFESKEDVIRCTETFGSEKIWAALDFGGNPPFARIKGWKNKTAVALPEAFRLTEECNVGGIIVSSVDLDGMEKGPDLQLLSKAVNICSKPVWLAGGMRDAKDAVAAFDLGAQGVIFGLSLYNGKMNFGELLRLQKE